MILETHITGPALVATVKVAEANLTIAETVKQEMAELILAGNKLIVVDLNEVIYVDSSFLGALVSSLKLALSQKAEIVLASLNKDVMGLFELIRLDKAFRIFATVDEALANHAG